MSRCSMTVWSGGGAAPRTDEIEPGQVACAIQGVAGLVWVDVVAPTPAEVQAIGESLHLGAPEIEDVMAPRERPKAARHGDRATFVVSALSARPDVTEALAADDEIGRVLEGEGARGDVGDALFEHARVSGVVLDRALVTVRSDAAFAVDEVRERWADLGDVAALGPEALVHGLLDVVVDGHIEALQFLDDRIEDLEDDLFAPGGRLPGFQRRTYALRKELVSVRRAVLPMREVLDVLRRWRADRSGHGPDAPRLDAHFADLADHVLRASEWTDALRDMVAAVFETHLSLQDQRLNEVTKRLAGWAAVISVPTLVTGWFGMNVPYPGHDSGGGLVAAALLTVVPAAGLWALMRRMRWL